MKRRDFLKQGGAGLAGGLAGATLVGRTFAAPEAVRPFGQERLKKAVRLGMVEGEGSVLEKFRLIKELGFDGVELPSPNDMRREDVLQARDEVGLPIHSVMDSMHWDKPFSSPDPAVRAEGLEALRTALKDAKAYGASAVLLVPAVVSKEISYDAAYRRSQAEIRKAVPTAEELGVKIAVENVWNNFLLSPLEMARYIDAFESPYVGAYFDIGNIVRYGWPAQWIRILGDRIAKLHVKGYSRKKQKEQGPWAGFVKIGDGTIDWEGVSGALADIGYTGWATAERPGGGREHLQDIARRMDRVLPT